MPPRPEWRHSALSLLLSSLVLVGLPAQAWDGGAHAAWAGSGGPAPRIRASALRAGSASRNGQSTTRLTLTAIDNALKQIGYRLLGDAVVERSIGGARQWLAILTGGSRTRQRQGGCHPARYSSVTALRTGGLLPGTLFVATSGSVGPAPRTMRDYGCDVATGGLFVLRPDGDAGIRRSDSLAAGLPYAQDPGGRSPRAYGLLDLTTDPGNPDVLYADAMLPAHGFSPANPIPVGLYRSIDGGRYWSPATFGLPRPGRQAAGWVRGSVRIDPALSTTVFDAIGPQLYRSQDRGAHWSTVRGIIARNSLRLFINPLNPRLMYALTDEGYFHSRDSGNTWTGMNGRGLPPPRQIGSVGFNAHHPGSFYVTPWHGHTIRLDERHVPARPYFDVALALTPQLYDRVVLALHADPLTPARLHVIGGAAPTDAQCRTDTNGVCYTAIRLRGRVVPASLRVRVQFGSRSQVLKPWLPPGWVPGHQPRPRIAPTSTPTATATPAATATYTPTATAYPSPTVTPTATIPTYPTAYPAGPLSAVWTWKALTPILPLCPLSSPAAATLTGVPSATGSAIPSIVPTAPPSAAWPPPSTTAGALPPSATPFTQGPTITPTVSATDTVRTPCDAGPPLPRQDFAMGWDGADHRMYVFGGTDSKTAAAYDDISAYSTITHAWVAIQPLTLPPPGRYGAAAAWDPVLNELFIFGGMTGAGPFAHFTNDLWAYSPVTNSWTQLAGNSAAGAPTPRSHAAAAWDPTNNRLLIFGGQINDGNTPTLINDLWSYLPATNSWTQLSANGGSLDLPPPRQWALMAWDTTAGVIRLFGGKNAGNGAMSDTWTWSPSAGWQFDNVADQPPGRQAGTYYWDETHARFVVGPGLSMVGDNADMWYFDGIANDWLQIPVVSSPTPPLRQMSRMVWDAADNQALLFGGRAQGTGVANDLWALIPTGASAPPTPQASQAPLAKAVDIGQTVARDRNTVLLTPNMVERVASSGAAYARVSFYIGDGAQTWTTARLQAYEQVVTMLGQHNIGVLAVAASGITGDTSAAAWLANAQETMGGNGNNPAIQNYGNQLAFLVSHFHDPPYSVRRWEVWNEPNVPLAGCTNFAISCLQQPSLLPSNFAALLAQAYTAVKTNPATRDVQLISGGIFGHSIGGGYSAGAAGADYLSRVYAEGISGAGLWPAVKASLGSYPLDAVGLHLYVDQSQRTTTAVVRTYLDWFHNAYAPFEPANKATIITEAGWRTGDINEPQVSLDIQAANLGTAFAAARRAGYVSDLSWFELQDNPGDFNSTSWGLLDRNGAAKLAFGQFQAE